MSSGKKIWANCIVRNEENFIWFSLMSVVDYVDRILVWDSGSKDKTVEIIKEAVKEKKGKIEFREVGPADKYEFTRLRQDMLNESKCDWVLILDGDEIWWNNSIKQLIDEIKEIDNKTYAFITPFYSMVGDVYHYQTQNFGKYEVGGMKGHLTIRAINRRIPGLHLAGPYGEEAYVDSNGKTIQSLSLRLKFADTPFMHLTHLKRSSKNGHNKYKYDEGVVFDKNFPLPEVFYLARPKDVPSPMKKRTKLYELISKGKKILKGMNI